MKEKLIKDALDNQAGMKALISNASWQDMDGECSNCGKATLQKAHTNPMRTLGGLVTCTSCNRTESFTNHFIKSAFPIEKMPEGALPFYH
jgi:ssDNA-binding Zn-finger/Zn-ribbon topoisomerase 1